jgi:hypothetical protein
MRFGPKHPAFWPKTFFILAQIAFRFGPKRLQLVVMLAFPDFTRHFFSSLAETVDSCFVVVLNR